MKIKIIETKTVEKKEEFLFDIGTYYFVLVEDNTEITYKKVTISPFKNPNGKIPKSNLFNIEWETVINEHEDKYGVIKSRVDCEFEIPWHLQKYFLKDPAEKYQEIKEITEEEFKEAKKKVIDKI